MDLDKELKKRMNGLDKELKVLDNERLKILDGVEDNRHLRKTESSLIKYNYTMVFGGIGLLVMFWIVELFLGK